MVNHLVENRQAVQFVRVSITITLCQYFPSIPLLHVLGVCELLGAVCIGAAVARKDRVRTMPRFRCRSDKCPLQ